MAPLSDAVGQIVSLLLVLSLVVLNKSPLNRDFLIDKKIVK